MSKSPLFIGVAGGTGSGKTTVARAIAKAFRSDQCAVLDLDSYYRDLAHEPFEERVKVNFDHPDALETELLCKHLDELRLGRSIEKPVYDFTTHTRQDESETIEPCPLIVVEGILALAHAGVRQRLDVKIFVDTDADVRLMRRIRRDLEERGRSFEDIRRQYYDSVRPMHTKFVEPSRKYADIIIPEGGQNTVGIGVVIHSLMRSVEQG